MPTEGTPAKYCVCNSPPKVTFQHISLLTDPKHQIVDSWFTVMTLSVPVLLYIPSGKMLEMFLGLTHLLCPDFVGSVEESGQPCKGLAHLRICGLDI
jgi:hypothetical protein